MAEKPCTKCGQTKSVNQFYKAKGKPKAACIDCSKAYSKEYEDKNKEHRNHKCREFNSGYYRGNRARFRDNYLKLHYGISLEDFNQMREEQEYSCALCHIHEDHLSRGLYVDHCHETGDVRGLLCNGCNAGLGMLGDNVYGLQRAIKYLNGETL